MLKFEARQILIDLLLTVKSANVDAYVVVRWIWTNVSAYILDNQSVRVMMHMWLTDEFGQMLMDMFLTGKVYE